MVIRLLSISFLAAALAFLVGRSYRAKNSSSSDKSVNSKTVVSGFLLSRADPITGRLMASDERSYALPDLRISQLRAMRNTSTVIDLIKENALLRLPLVELATDRSSRGQIWDTARTENVADTVGYLDPSDRHDSSMAYQLGRARAILCAPDYSKNDYGGRYSGNSTEWIQSALEIGAPIAVPLASLIETADDMPWLDLLTWRDQLLAADTIYDKPEEMQVALLEKAVRGVTDFKKWANIIIDSKNESRTEVLDTIVKYWAYRSPLEALEWVKNKEVEN